MDLDDLDDLDEIIDCIDEIELNNDIEPNNYQATIEKLYENLHILNVVSGYKQRVLQEKHHKDLFDLNFAY
ncbi:hypothetical protein OJ16_06485 [Vibrio renipiscarius]|uniref:Uncharacterized protein n=2 Tax=Vibrio renipiscarius TaxID=1461322 RepID=A0A0C2KFG4_9VIBR|nr:hypothetical protein OJ16_06485 [Vibrio renipiscarius]